jgi:hypothetical protein
MSFSLKYFSIQILVFLALLASTNLFACTAESVFNDNLSDTVLTSIQIEKSHNLSINTANKNQVHQHSQMSDNSGSKTESNTFHKNCKCCEFGGCASCVGCSGSCGAATISASSNSEPTNTPLARFVQMPATYISVSTTPLEHPPK